MEKLIHCTYCQNEIYINYTSQCVIETIRLTCTRCNKSYTHNLEVEYSRIVKLIPLNYRTYNHKLYSNRRIIAIAVVVMMFSMVFSGSRLDIFYQPLQILASVFLAFVAFELGSGRIRIEYSDKEALNSIIVR